MLAPKTPLAAARLGRGRQNKSASQETCLLIEFDQPGGVSWWEWTDADRQARDEFTPHLRDAMLCAYPLPASKCEAGLVDRSDITLSICLRCRDGREVRDTDLDQRGGRRLARAVVDAFPESAAQRLGVTLRGVNCMSQCKRPCAIALSAPGRFTYLFGDLDPTVNAPEVLAVAAAYAQTETGLLPRPQRPEVLQAGILGRVPPLGHSGDLIEPLIPEPSNDPMEPAAL